MIDLRAAIGKKYLVTMDESFEHVKPEDRKEEEPWCQQVEGEYGVVYPQSETEIAVGFRHGRGGDIRAKKFETQLPGSFQKIQDSDEMVVYKTPVGNLEIALKSIKGNRKRRYSVEEIEIRRDRLKKARELRHNGAIKPITSTTGDPSWKNGNP